ncbi:SKP1-like protein 1B [Capsicum chacoense]
MASTTYGDEFEVVILKSSNGDEFKLKKSIAVKYSVTIRHMVALDVTTSIIPIPHVDTQNLFKIVEYLEMHGTTEVSGEEIKSYDEKLATAASFKSLLDFVWAAKYLGIKGLNELCTEEFNQRRKGKSRTEIRNTYHDITRDFTKEKVQVFHKEFKWALGEERIDFVSILTIITMILMMASVAFGVVPLRKV